jgi:iron(III) transport system substrate-binding protein
MRLSRRSFLATAAATGLAGHATAARAAGGVVNIYSYRQPALIDPLLAAFTAKTGIEARSIFAENGLVERLAQEGRNSPCDVLLTVDIGRLYEATGRDLAQAVDSAFIRDHVPANLRDAGNRWFALTMRARVIYAANDRVSQKAFSYEELADPKWQGKICIRPGNHPYNLGLIAALIAHKGEDWTRHWLSGLKANLAIKPSGNDRSQAKSVYSGECDLAIANTYYLGVMATNEAEPEQKEWAKAVHIVFPSSPEIGTHVNVSGMLMASNAPNRDNALALMEFLASDEAQHMYAAGNFEYPVNPDVAPIDLVKSWGAFTPDTLNIVEVARNEAAAARLVDEVQFND